MTRPMNPIYVLLDVNHMVDALEGKTVPRTVEELLLLDSVAAAVAATEGVHLLGSEHTLVLLEEVLQRELGYSEAEAIQVTDLYEDLADRTGGEWISSEEGRHRSADIAAAIPGALLGRGAGQVDDEDLQVLGAAYAVARDGHSAIIVTRDGGLLNVAGASAQRGVLVMHRRRLQNSLSGMRRMGR